MAFGDGLAGELLVEEVAVLLLDVNGVTVAIGSVVDLVHVLPDRVEEIDYKIYRSRHAVDECRRQLSVYSHVLEDWLERWHLDASTFFTVDGSREPVEPLPVEALHDMLRSATG